MSKYLRLLIVPARRLSRGGFTLVELLVVIGIIAILAGVALGPITKGIQKAKQSAGVQTARTIGLAEFSFANDNNQTYPDTGNKGSGTITTSDASCVASALLGGNYISDASIFYISGSPNESKYTGTPVTSIAKANISWDFAAYSGKGLGANEPDQTPVVWSSVTTAPTLTGSGVTTTVASTNPFGTQGLAVAFKSNSAAFKVANASNSVTIADTTYGGLGSESVLSGNG